MPREVEAVAEPAVLAPGQFVLFDSKCVHSSITNQDPTGSAPRVALALRIIPASTAVHHHAFQPSQGTVPLGEAGPCHTTPSIQEQVTKSDSNGPECGPYRAVLLTVPSNPVGRAAALEVVRGLFAAPQLINHIFVTATGEPAKIEQFAMLVRCIATHSELSTVVTVFYSPGNRKLSSQFKNLMNLITKRVRFTEGLQFNTHVINETPKYLARFAELILRVMQPEHDAQDSVLAEQLQQIQQQLSRSASLSRTASLPTNTFEHSYCQHPRTQMLTQQMPQLQQMQQQQQLLTNTFKQQFTQM